MFRALVPALCAVFLGVASASAISPQPLSVPNASFDPVLDGPDGIAPFSGIPTSQTSSPTLTCTYIVVQRSVPITPAWRQAFVDRGAEILAVFPVGALLMRAPPGFDPVNGDTTVRWRGAYRPAYKVHAALGAAILGMDVSALLDDNGMLPIAVIVHRGESVAAVELQVRSVAPPPSWLGP